MKNGQSNMSSTTLEPLSSIASTRSTSRALQKGQYNVIMFLFVTFFREPFKKLSKSLAHDAQLSSKKTIFVKCRVIHTLILPCISVMTIQYSLRMDKPESHYFRVEITIPIEGVRNRKKIRFVMPVWTPGSYLVREFSRNVIDFNAFDSQSRSKLVSYKDSKNSWTVEIGEKEPEEIYVSYRVYAFEYTVDTSYLDTRHGIINGASVFMYPEGLQNEPLNLNVVAFSNWKVVATSLDPSARDDRDGSTSFKVENFDILIDSPIEIGNQELQSFTVEGIEHKVSMFGPKPIDSEQFVSDLKKIVEAEARVFNQIPYKRYLFLVDFAGSNTGGGLEHLSSTHCIAPRLRLIPSQEYKFLMGLFSHELFHAWNVKRMRPVGLGPFNYSSETYTKSLWIAEGITSYYDDLILRRCGVYSVADYFEAFCANVNVMNFLPAPRYESAEESSFDTWIRHYRPDENSPNVHSSYYNQGAVIGWMIDMEIRNSTGSEKTLDHAMRKLYVQTYIKENRGYTEDEFEKICNELCGKNLSKEIFDKRVRGHERVDFDRYLGYAGLKLGPKDKSTSPKGFLGVKLKQESGKVLVASKLFSSPADECGLAAHDEILALDNLRVDGATLPFYISNKKPGDKVSMLISRDGMVETLFIELAEYPQIENRIYKQDKASDAEKSVFKNWMIEDWDKPIEYSQVPPSPLRPKTLDYV